MNLRDKWGIALNHFGHGELGFYSIRNANELVAKNPNLEFLGFYDEPALPAADYNFSLIPMSYSYRFDGNMIVTSLDLARKSLNMCYLKQRYFYIWDLDWIRPWKRDWKESCRIYNDPRFIRIARSEDHAKVIESVCGCHVDKIVERCNLEKIIYAEV